MSQFTGKIISLIDTRNIRYVGSLASISAETKTIELKDVTVFGTESRVSGPEAVPKKDVLVASMKFEGKDVSDLQVLESEVTGSQPSAEQHEAASQKNNNDINDNEDFFARTQRLASTPKDIPLDTGVAYDKSSSFFDTLGSSGSGRTTWAEESSKNMETFGESGSQPRGGYRVRGNRGRRGGRGGSRGGSRGGPRSRGGFRAHGRDDGQNAS